MEMGYLIVLRVRFGCKFWESACQGFQFVLQPTNPLVGTLAVPASSLESISWVPAGNLLSLDIVIKYISVRPYSAKGPIEGILFNGL